MSGTEKWPEERFKTTPDTSHPTPGDTGHPTLEAGASVQETELEAQRRQAQKMEVLGRLAGGIAHDFNNLLTVILGYSDLLVKGLPPGNPVRDGLVEIQKAAEHAASLTRQLLIFSRKQALTPRVLDLNRIVSNMDKLLRRLIGEDIELWTLLGSHLGPIKADARQIEQVILNLALNARDAMPRGGKLTVETANVELDEAYASRHLDVQPGPYVMLAVSDTGYGMDAVTQTRLFEPFFTTKEPGKGTGLGLATVYGIVKQSGGHIWVYSEPNQGTTFKIYLPRVAEPVEKTEPDNAPTEPPRGSETILLVEDDDRVRLVAREVLQRYGYQVLEAGDGGEALTLCRQHPGPIHLLVTDMVMPYLSGRELARQVATLRPKVQVLYISGYTDSVIVHHGLLEASLPHLQKPFTADALVRKVRELLDLPPTNGLASPLPFSA